MAFPRRMFFFIVIKRRACTRPLGEGYSRDHGHGKAAAQRDACAPQQ
jgi:hypothetical protein